MPLGSGQKEASLWPNPLPSVAKRSPPLAKLWSWRHFNFIMASIKCCLGVKYAEKRRQHRWVSSAGKQIVHRRNQIVHRRDSACLGRESRLGGRGFLLALYQEAICPIRRLHIPVSSSRSPSCAALRSRRDSRPWCIQELRILRYLHRTRCKPVHGPRHPYRRLRRRLKHGTARSERRLFRGLLAVCRRKRRGCGRKRRRRAEIASIQCRHETPPLLAHCHEQPLKSFFGRSVTRSFRTTSFLWLRIIAYPIRTWNPSCRKCNQIS